MHVLPFKTFAKALVPYGRLFLWGSNFCYNRGAIKNHKKILPMKYLGLKISKLL